ncbi:hypothetical protein L218DRAFT_990118 [Marasmius fiardii PR-910]|nr:hypothetical protein L218DRAFT_990118 [Marasmius fiardii PR-910]
MGTGGYIVYRYKRVKYAKCSRHDSYPEYLGVKLLCKIPKPSDGEGWQARFEEWLQEHRAMMEKSIADATCGMSPEEVEAVDIIESDDKNERWFFNADHEPLRDPFFPWVWEMDLDNLCFLVNGHPLHRLDYLPTEEVFLSDYSEDEYAFLRSNTEELSKHAYVHKIILRPSEEDPATLHNYSLFCAGTVLLHEILGVKETLSHAEILRLRWVEILVGCAKFKGGRCARIEHSVLKLEANGGASALDAIPARTCEKLKDLIFQIFRPYFYGLHYFLREPLGRRSRRTLPGCPNIYILRHNTVFCIQNHLDDPNCLHTSSYNLFKAIMDNFPAAVPQEPFIYGILFSGTQCAIVRVDRRESRFTHTTSMPFFPNDYLHEPRSSGGITALARLASKIDPDYFEIDSNYSKFVGGPLSSRGGLFEKLPLELIDMIADMCSHDFLHLRNFAGISTRTRDAALNASVRCIFIDNFRLAEAIDKPGVSTGFDKKMLKYLEENESCSGLFSLETAQNRPAFCVVGYEERYSTRPRPPFGTTTLLLANKMCYGLFSLEGKEMDDEAIEVGFRRRDRSISIV